MATVPWRAKSASIAVALFALLLAPGAYGASWSRVTSSPDGLVDFYIDRAGITGSDPRSVRILYDYRDVQQDPDTLVEQRSSIITARIDCRHSTITIIQSRDFGERMARGKPSSVSAVRQPVQKHIADGTIDQRIQQAVCKLR